MEEVTMDDSGNTAGGGGINGGWSEYFLGDPYSDLDSRAILLNELTSSLEEPGGQQLLAHVIVNGSTYALPVNADSLRKDFVLPESFFAVIAENSHNAISCLGAAAYNILFGRNGRFMRPGRIHVRIFNLAGSTVILKNLKAATIGKLISVHGRTIRTSIVKPMVVSMTFACSRCGYVTEQMFKDGIYAKPTECPGDDCRSRTFKTTSKSAKLIDFQKIKIQEIVGPNNHEDGRLPRTVDCELREDLVDACGTGDVVTVCGFVEVIGTDTDSVGGRAKDDGLRYLYIQALSIVHAKDFDKEGQFVATEQRAPGLRNAFTSLDLEFVVKFAEEGGPDLFHNIVHSICPSIYGLELVKAGIALALFGGVQHNFGDNNKVPVRGDIHVLIVGDPGLGKSQLLKAAAALAGRGVYVCGSTTTNAGLTVAVVKDALSGDYAFEAGAMVLADKGTCCIDEFDNLSAQHEALLESMEQQCVSIAKAGLVASLPTQTLVLAAANPVGGRYNRSKTLNQNVKMSAALLSWFDLVFILLDKPDEARDHRLSEHIIALHSGSVEQEEGARRALLQPSSSSGQQAGRTAASLAKRLKLNRGTGFEPLPPQLLRKYIAYARQYVLPNLSTEAAEVLRRFYLQLRRNTAGDGTPITARQLESLVRLAKARARAELREEVTKQDALDVVDMMRESLFDTFIDEHGCLDFGRSGGLSHEREAKRFLSAVQQRCDILRYSVVSMAELYMVADEIGVKVKDLDALIGMLNLHGYLLKKGASMYQVGSSS